MAAKLTDALIASADALRDAGNIDDALVAYQAIVAEFPQSPVARHRLGTAFTKLNKTGDAERCYREAISIWHEYPEANNMLGLILFARGNFAEAEMHYRVALAERPDFLGAHLNLGVVLNETFHLLAAKYHANRALILDPESPDAHLLLGKILRNFGQTTAGKIEFQRALDLDPNFASAWNNLGTYFRAVGRLLDAEKAFTNALSAIPDFLPAWNGLLLSSNYRHRDKDEVFQLHRSFGALVRKQCGELAVGRPDSRPKGSRRLRIGFVSGDLRRNSVAYFIRGAVETLDRKQYQLFAYYNFRVEDEVTFELKPLFHRWRTIYGLGDREAIDLIRQDGIDILVDLCGHTATFRPIVIGSKPAPLQVSWIGYPNTTGFDCIDYRITDAWADPEGEGDAYYTEQLWRLSSTFLCYSPPKSAPDVRTPPRLDVGWITFGSFNNRAKLSDQCLELWCRVLLAVPDSRLVIKSVFGVDDDEQRQELIERFESLGIGAGRVDVRKPLAALEDHLAAYHDVDIAFDSFPYHGTTTTCEALWMGVPVVTLAGDRHASRVGVSLLNNVGLGELVAASSEEYVRIAMKLAAHPDRLADMRASMRERMIASRLMDQRAMGSDLGGAFREMWRRYCASFPVSLPIEGGSVDHTADLLRLHIGGVETREGWKVLDIEQREGVDFVGDIRNLESFADETCIEVYCSHVLEHVGYAEMLDTLNGLHRVLVPGGKLYLSVPDLDMLACLFVNPDIGTAQRFEIMRMMFGRQANEFDYHKVGLNFDFLEAYLRDVGFTGVEHVESFDIFDDMSNKRVGGHLVSLNLVVTK